MAKLFFTMLKGLRGVRARPDRRAHGRGAEIKRSRWAPRRAGAFGYHKVGAGKNAMLEPIPGSRPLSAACTSFAARGKACGPSLPPSPPSSTCRSLPWRLTVF